MKEGNTKALLLEKSLDLFARRGYDEVTVQEIADAVGIKAPSLYKHYKSKQEIFDSIYDEMSAHFNDNEQSIGLLPDTEEMAQSLKNGGKDTLLTIGIKKFKFVLSDEKMAKFRRLLVIGQYSNKKLADIYQVRYFEEPLKYCTKLFSAMIKNGLMIKADPAVMAYQFNAPIFHLVCRCDLNPQFKPEAQEMVKKHFKQFIKLYCTNPEGVK
jgi:AcrR family transcriptional regulator